LELTYDECAPSLRPVLDNQGAANVVTVSQRSGYEVTVEDRTSEMGAQPTPDGIGPYKMTVNTNLQDDADADPIALWWLSRGTVPDARYPTVTVDLDAYPVLATTVRGVRIGDRLTITGLDPDAIDLLVIGFKDQQKTQKRNLVTFICEPYGVLDVGVYDDTSTRYDSRTTTLGASRDTTQTSWTFSSTDRFDAWSTTEEPYNVECDGEVVTVTSMGAVSGSGPYTQTATVVRSVNGIVKTHSAGARIQIADPAYWAL
jgi:hypothetical protein